VVYGQDREFRTKGQRYYYPHIIQKRLWMTPNGTVIVRLRCTGNHKCTGAVTLNAKHRKLGSSHYSLLAGHGKQIKVRLARKAQDLVRSHHGLRVKVTTGGSHRTLVMRWTR
jgi:hypothetical protein